MARGGPHPAQAGAGALAALVIGLAACAEMIQREDLVMVQQMSPSAHACGECHVAIFEEWAASAHARAFTNSAFQRATLSAQTRPCMPCHIPDSVLHAAGQPATRTLNLDEGVTCIACHLDQRSQAMVGPLTGMGPVVPHAVIEGDEWFRSDALCGTCHTGTLRETQRFAASVGESRTCQECHMGAVDRKTTQATDALSTAIVAMHEVHPGRSHTFEIGAVADFPGALSATARARGASVEVDVTNRLPHPIPTGDFGHREVVLVAESLDEAGRALSHAERHFLNRAGQALEPGATVRIALAGAGDPTAARVSLRRLLPGEREPLRLAEITIPIGAGTP